MDRVCLERAPQCYKILETFGTLILYSQAYSESLRMHHMHPH